MKRLAELEKTLREKNVQRFMGMDFEVLFETEKNGIYTGHTENMLEVSVPCETDIRGKIEKVKIIGYDGENIIAEIV